MIVRLLLLMSLVLAPAVTSFAASSDIYKAIPADSLGFLLINRLKDTSDKLSKTAQQIQAPLPPVPLLMLVQQMTGVTQLNEDESAAFVFLPGATPAAPPRMAVLAPTADYAKLLAGLQPDDPKALIANVMVAGTPSIAAKKGQYAVFMGGEPADLAAMKKFLASATDISGAVKPLKKWLDTQEIAGLITPDGNGLLFEKMDGGMAGLGEQLPPDQAASMKVFSDLAKLLQREVSYFAFGLRIDDAGVLDLTTRSIFLPAGALARAAKDAATPDTDIFAALPAGPFVFAVSGALPEAWADAIADVSIQFAKASPEIEMSDEQQENMAEATRQLMKGLRGASLEMGVPKPGEPLYSRMMGFLRVKDSQRYLDEQKKSNEALNKLKIQGAAYEFNMKEVEGFPGMEMTVAAADENAPNAAMQKMILDKMLGPNGKAYIAAINPNTVAMAYVNSKNITQLAERFKSSGPGLARDPDVKLTAALLPTDCQWTGYVSPAGCMALVRAFTQMITPPGQAPALKVPDFPKSPPFGVTAKLLPFGFETHVIAPAETLSAIGEFVAKSRGEAQQ
jgi:hypothetical protein